MRSSHEPLYKGSLVHLDPRRIVVVQSGYIGDVVLTTPLLFNLMNHFPAAKTSIVVGPEKAALAACIPGIDRIVPFDKRGDDAGPFGLVKAARRLREMNFDLLVAPHRSSRTAILGALARVRRRVGFRNGPVGWLYTDRVEIRKNEPCRLEQDFDLLRHLGLALESVQPRLIPPPHSIEYADHFMRARGLDGERLVGVCVGANWATKRWPVEQLVPFCSLVSEMGYTAVLFGGPKEISLEAEVIAALEQLGRGHCANCTAPHVHSSIGNSLVEALALFARCSVVVGADSGLTHIARAVGAPTVVLYGPTDHRLHNLPANSVAKYTDVYCRPCHRHGQQRCPLNHHRCMRDLSAYSVAKAVQSLGENESPEYDQR